MKFKALLMASCLLILGLTLSSEAQSTLWHYTKNLPLLPAVLPDLVVTSVKAKDGDLDSGQLVVTVKNQGRGNAASSSLLIFMNNGSSTPVTKSASEPALSSGQSTTIVVNLGGGLSQLNVCAKADGANKVTETNEMNNKLCIKFGGKP